MLMVSLHNLYYGLCTIWFSTVLCAVIPSVRCHCWSDDVKGIRSIKSLVPTFPEAPSLVDIRWTGPGLPEVIAGKNKLVKEKLKIVVAVMCCQLPTIVTLSLSTLSHIFDRKSDLSQGFWAFFNIMAIIQQVRKWPEDWKVRKFKKEWKVNGKQEPHSTMAVIAWYVLLSMVSSQVQAMTPSEHLLYH